MGIFDRLRGRSRDKPKNDANLVLSSAFGWLLGNTYGQPVNPTTAMQLTAVNACVRVLSEAVAGLPLHFYRYRQGGGKELVLDDNLYYLVHDAPNEDMTSFTFRETLMTHLLLWGNAYAQIVRNGRGEVVGLYPLAPDRVTVNRTDDGRLYYQYIIGTTDVGPKSEDVGDVVTLRDYQVLHIPGLSFNGLVGLSPLEMARTTMGAALNSDEFGGKFFENGAMPSGIIEYPKKIADVSAFRASFEAAFSGAKNAGKTPVLEEGMTYKPISITPEQAQFLETRKFMIDEIARIFRVPPHIIGDLDRATFSNIEQQSLEFVKYTLYPWICRWEQAMNRKLLLPNQYGKYFFKFNVDGLLRGDYQSRMNGYAVGRQNGWMSANDIRGLEDMDRIPSEEGGDLYLVNGSMTPLADAGAAYGEQPNLDGKEEATNE